MKGSRILIAGGSGMLGTHITRNLLKKNLLITSSFFSKVQGKKIAKVHKKYNFLKLSDCIKATKNKKIVIICAVQGAGIKKLSSKNLYRQNLDNISIRLNLLEACKINKISKVIWVGSSTLYQPYNKKICENDLDLNIEPYSIYQSLGAGYRYTEQMMKYYSDQFNIDIKIIRTTSIYGPFDNFDEEKSHVVPALIKKIFKKGKYLKVLGSKKVVRDFVFSQDLADFICLLINFKGKKFDVFNFSSGEKTTIAELAKKLIKISSTKKKIKFINKKLSSADYRVLDNQKVIKKFKFKKRTRLDEGLKKTISWYLENYK
jgi:GDP-L-fucose synthase